MFERSGVVRLVEARLLAVAPWILAVSLLDDVLAVSTKLTSGVDLLIYQSAVRLLPDGHLYDFHLGVNGPSSQLMPFTYPPFAALLFLLLAWLPWVVLKWVWHVIALACVWSIVRTTLALLGHRGPVWTRRAVLVMAVVIWLEPVRVTMMWGQINLLLVAVVLAGVFHTRDVWAGAAVGVTAGIKLTPAMAGLYFLATRRFRAALWSFGVFAATVVAGFLVIPGQAWNFWVDLLADTDRVGPVATTLNQSLRGALGRSLGYDPAFAAPWLVLVGVVVVVAVVGVRGAVRAGDRLAALLVVQLTGLLVLPISWNHHFVWAVPVLLWAAYGPARGSRLVVGAGACWVVVTGSWVTMIMLQLQPDGWVFARPWWQAALSWGYPVAAVVTVAAVAVVYRRVEVAEPALTDRSLQRHVLGLPLCARHQGTVPASSKNPPVGPSSGRVAR